jgi:hypothetical protein
MSSVPYSTASRWASLSFASQSAVAAVAAAAGESVAAEDDEDGESATESTIGGSDSEGDAYCISIQPATTSALFFMRSPQTKSPA